MRMALRAMGGPGAPLCCRLGVRASLSPRKHTTQQQQHLSRAASTTRAAAPALPRAAAGGGSSAKRAAPAAAPAEGPRPLPRVVLKGGKSKLFTGDTPSPMVYSGAVDRVVGRPAPQAGDPVLVCDGAEKPIGWGVYNPHSMFRVRMMQLADECFGSGAALAAGQHRPDLPQLVASRIQQAVALRATLGLRCCSPAAPQGAEQQQQQHGQQEHQGAHQQQGGQQAQPTSTTTVFRLCNSEGDRLSGLVVDALGPHLVVASSAAWVERNRESISECLRQATGLSSIVWRPALDMLREEGCAPEGEAGAGAGASMAEEAETPAGLDGAIAGAGAGTGSTALEPVAGPATAAAAAGQQKWDAKSQGQGAAAAAAAAAEAAGPVSSGGGGLDEESAAAAPGTVVVLENGIKYAAAPLGQKTGFYADQRDNRAALRQLSAGARVLDMCCYSGGFALNAAAGGAVEVTGVDSSAAAVALASRNAELNGLGGVCSFVRADVADFMKQALAERRTWDIVVFDPPKLAPSRKALEKAARKYRRLNAMAMQLVEPGGLLMTCSCSGAMSQSGEFVPTLQAAARDAGRKITVLRVAGAAPDHTLDPCYPEGQYLTNCLLRVL